MEDSGIGGEDEGVVWREMDDWVRERGGEVEERVLRSTIDESNWATIGRRREGDS